MNGVILENLFLHFMIYYGPFWKKLFPLTFFNKQTFKIDGQMLCCVLPQTTKQNPYQIHSDDPIQLTCNNVSVEISTTRRGGLYLISTLKRGDGNKNTWNNWAEKVQKCLTHIFSFCHVKFNEKKSIWNEGRFGKDYKITRQVFYLSEIQTFFLYFYSD